MWYGYVHNNNAYRVHSIVILAVETSNKRTYMINILISTSYANHRSYVCTYADFVFSCKKLAHNNDTCT